MIKPTHQIAYDYCMAMIQQGAAVDQINRAFSALCSDNTLFSLCEPIEGAYTKLVEGLLGPQLWDWLMWWMYETDHGTKQMEFWIDDTKYDPTHITLYKFLEIVDN
jgi:hypothetical protein